MRPLTVALSCLLLNVFPSIAAVSLAEEAAGRHSLRSIHGTYLRHENLGSLDLVPDSSNCEQWYIQAYQGKVTLRPECSFFRDLPIYPFLRAHQDGFILFSLVINDALWTPTKNEDGSWSFASEHGGMLSAAKNGTVYIEMDVPDTEAAHFWLNSETDLSTSTAPASPSPDASESDEDSKEKEEDGDRRFSAEIAGKRTLKSFYGAFLRAWANETDWFVGAVQTRKECEQWYIEDHRGKVAFKAYCSGKYLRANKELYVDLGDQALAHEMWKPIKNWDGSWSFQSHHGTWLRAQPHGRISLQTAPNADETFRLGSWTELIRTTTSSPPPTTTEVIETTTTGVTATTADSTTTTTEAPTTAANTSTTAQSSTLPEVDELGVTSEIPQPHASHTTVIVILASLLIILIFLVVAGYSILLRQRSILKRGSSLSQRDLVVGYSGLEEEV